VKSLRRNAIASERSSYDSEDYDSEEDRKSVNAEEDGFVENAWRTMTLQKVVPR
jgi:hypothetical protein